MGRAGHPALSGAGMGMGAGRGGASPTRHRSTASPTRQRKTVRFDHRLLSQRLDDAVEAECRRLAAGSAGWVGTAGAGGGQRLSGAQVREGLLALLKAFCDAAQPAGGLPLDDRGDPADLPALRAAGQANARQADTEPKLLAKARAGRPVDLRIAVAALHFFRAVLERPRLGLADIGGTENERLEAVQRVERALEVGHVALPASVFEALRRRAHETAAYPQILDDVRVHYGDLREVTDERGHRRFWITRTSRYVPVRLAGFADRLMPTGTFEWHEWVRMRSARLWVCPRSGTGALGTPVELPVQRTLDHDAGIFRFEVDRVAAADRLHHLVIAPAGAGQPAPEIVWVDEISFNPADRDILVWYAPVLRLRVSVDETLAQRLAVVVGDSPGVLGGDQAWTLDRTLMPREVIAVRLRARELGPRHLRLMGASGEVAAAALAADAAASPAGAAPAPASAGTPAPAAAGAGALPAATAGAPGGAA